MEIQKNLHLIRNALFLKKEETLILSDLHIGQDESMNANGILLPRFQYEDLFKETNKLIQKLKPKTIILNGDIKHEFSGNIKEEIKKVKHYIEHIKKRSKLIIIKGNHDAILQKILNKDIQVKKYHKIKSFFICHGDKLFDEESKDSKTIIIGHEHPAITLTRGVRQEKYKCFLRGKYKNKNLIVMPTINPTSEGTNILKEKLLSPYLKNNKDILNFKAIITQENETYDFGKIKNLEK